MSARVSNILPTPRDIRARYVGKNILENLALATTIQEKGPRVSTRISCNVTNQDLGFLVLTAVRSSSYPSLTRESHTSEKDGDLGTPLIRLAQSNPTLGEAALGEAVRPVIQQHLDQNLI